MTNKIEMTYEEVKPLLLEVVSKMTTEELGDFSDEIDGMIIERSKPVPTLTRDEVVEKAKKCIAANLSYSTVQYVVNPDKRVVVAIIKEPVIGRIRSKGIAKCDPNDCFNEYIGKAIALRRALGYNVPDEYINAPQPEGKWAGDIVAYEGKSYKLIEVSWRDVHSGNAELGSFISDFGKVIDDSARYR